MGNVFYLVSALLVIAWLKSGVTLVTQGYPAHGAMTLAYLGSLVFVAMIAWRKGHGKATATANAYAAAMAAAESKAQATAHAQQAVVVNIDTSQGARSVAARELGGLDAVSWRGESVPLIEQDIIDDVDEDVLAEIREKTIEST